MKLLILILGIAGFAHGEVSPLNWATLGEGESVKCRGALLAEQATIVALVKADGWPVEGRESFPILTAGRRSNRIELDAGGLTIRCSGWQERLSIPALGSRQTQQIIVRWFQGKLSLLVNQKVVASLDEVSFSPFQGILECVQPNRRRLPYKIVAVAAAPVAIGDDDLGGVISNLEELIAKRVRQGEEDIKRVRQGEEVIRKGGDKERKKNEGKGEREKGKNGGTTVSKVSTGLKPKPKPKPKSKPKTVKPSEFASFKPTRTATCKVRHYPSLHKLDLEWDLEGFRGVPLKHLAIEVHFIDRKANKVVLSHGIPKVENYAPQVRLSTNRIPPGQIVLASIIGADRKEVGRTVSTFTQIRQPDWLDNLIGATGSVPAPFTPLRVEGKKGVEGRKIHVIGRTYDFGLAALPEQIYIDGEPILAGPISLVSSRPDKWSRDIARDIKWGLGAGNPIEFPFLSIRSDRASWESASSTGDEVRPGVSGWAEYDGLLWFKVHVRGKRWRNLDTLKLTIPLKKEWSSLVSSDTVSYGPLPEKGISSRQGPVWLGNERGGIQWLTEWNQTWQVVRPEQAVQVIPREKDTLLQVSFIDHEVASAIGFKTEFGIIATPVRPVVESGKFRSEDLKNIRNTLLAVRNDGTYKHNPLLWLGWAQLQPKGKLMPADSKALSGLASPVISFNQCSTSGSPLGKQMQNLMAYNFYEWSADRETRLTSGLSSLRCAPTSKSWQDILMWLYERAYLSRPYNDIYIIDSSPIVSNNPDAGGGVEIRGVVSKSWSLLGSRTLARRLYTMLHQHAPDGRVIFINSGQPMAPLLSFADQVVASRSDISERMPPPANIFGLPLLHLSGKNKKKQ